MSSEPEDRNLSAAFRPLEARDDENLVYYFTLTRSVQGLAQFNQVSIGVGLKGAGKTATFRYLTEYDTEKQIAIPINESTHSLHLPQRDLHYSTCRSQFEADLVMDALRAIDENKSALASVCDAKLLDSASKLVHNYKEALKKYLGWFGGISILGCGLTIKKQETPVLVGLGRKQPGPQPDKLLKQICDSGVRLRIVVDDPENVFSSSRELDTHLVGGFLLAAIKVSQLCKNFKVVALVKTHVHSPVCREVEDISKYPESWTRLGWDKDSLTDMVKERLRWAKGAPRRKSDSVSLTELFDVRSEPEAEAMLADMIATVRNGPRDLIYWISRALAHAEKSGRRRVTAPAKKQGYPEASIRSLRELEAANHSQYPDVAEVIRLVFRKKKVFGVGELREHLADLLINNRDMRSLARHEWMQRETSTTLPFRLGEVGALAFEIGNQRFLPYSADCTPENLQAASRILLCPMLAPAVDRDLVTVQGL